MSAKVKLSSKLPGKEEWNGLDHYAADIAADPTLMLGCWVVLGHPRTMVNHEAGTSVPVMEVRSIEVVTTDGTTPDVDTIKAVVDAAFFERTGKQPLPIGEAFGGGPVPDAEPADD